MGVSSQNLSKALKSTAWLYGGITTGLVVLLEWMRQLHWFTPAPFLLLLAAVAVSAGLGGLRSGLISAIAFSAYVLYAASAHFGPTALTGGIVQVSLGITIAFGVSLLLGYKKRRHDQQVRSLQHFRQPEWISAHLSHEVRTPLTSMYTALNLLRDQLVPLESDRARRLIELASDGAEHLLMVVNHSLAAERLASGQWQLSKRPCHLSDLIERSIALMRLTAEQANVTIVTQLSALEIVVDPDCMQQVLTNLLSNAIKFSPAGTIVELTAAPIDQGVEIVVRDRGRGIPPDKLALIFDRFQQVNASDAQLGGIGLGLAICRHWVQQHGGKIWAESELGQGSRFILILPLK
jgi:signal transduction histidine kinase